MRKIFQIVTATCIRQLRNVFSLVFSLRGRFDHRTKLNKWNTTFLRFYEYIFKGQKNIFDCPREKFFLRLLARQQKYIVFLVLLLGQALVNSNNKHFTPVLVFLLFTLSRQIFAEALEKKKLMLVSLIGCDQK